MLSPWLFEGIMNGNIQTGAFIVNQISGSRLRDLSHWSYSYRLLGPQATTQSWAGALCRSTRPAG